MKIPPLPIIVALLIWPAVAAAQKTCTPVVAGTSQNCLVTITVEPGIPVAGSVQADSFKIRRGDGGGAKVVIGTVPFNNLSLQNTFTDAGNVAHCFDAVSVKGGMADSAPSPQTCWTTPALAPATVTTPQGLTLSAISSSSIRVSWDDTPDETGYELWARPSKGPKNFNLVANLPTDTVTFDYGSLKRYTTYCAEVRGKIGQTVGAFSDVRCATTSK